MKSVLKLFLLTLIVLFAAGTGVSADENDYEIRVDENGIEYLVDGEGNEHSYYDAYGNPLTIEEALFILNNEIIESDPINLNPRCGTNARRRP